MVRYCNVSSYNEQTNRGGHSEWVTEESQGYTLLTYCCYLWNCHVAGGVTIAWMVDKYIVAH